MKYSAGFCLIATILFLSLVSTGRAQSQEQESIEDLRRRLEEQEEYLRSQGRQLQTQQEEMKRLLEEIDDLKKSIEEMEQTAGKSDAASASASQVEANTHKRDSVGDLNAESVSVGSFPGSFVVPGSLDVSLAIGGFIKTVAISDSSAENMGADLLPSLLGTQRDDTRGKFAIDSTLTRLFLDARAPVKNGSLRGYIEYDLNLSNDNSLHFKVRHAYGYWENRHGRLTMGHTWSTLMDLGIIPEGLTEPTVSGAIFTRQAQLRWRQNLSEDFKAEVAVEHPSDRDVYVDPATNQIFRSEIRFPDVIAAVQYEKSGAGHLRFAGIVRQNQLTSVDGRYSLRATGWGLTLGGHLTAFGRDKAAFSMSYGSGLGRYLLGLSPTAGGMFDLNDVRLRLRDNYGGLVWYKHYWSENLRSTFAVGAARSDPFASQPDTEFKSSTYTYGNLMWTVLPYLNLGIEYDYGRRSPKNADNKDNHRLMFGMQIF